MAAGSVAVPTIIPLRPPILGQSKTNIDSATKVEFKSETPGATIYYTLTGSKPEPFLTIGPAAKSTFLYKQPITLPAGKHTIKAVAVSVDGRESFVVTKVFDVEYNSNEKIETSHKNSSHNMKDFTQNNDAKKEVRKFVQNLMTSKEAWQEVQKLKTTENGQAKGTSRFLSSRCASSRENTGLHLDMSAMDSSRVRVLPNDASQALRLQRETDYMKCVFCFAPRPSDPFAQFCNECGGAIPPLPQNRLGPPEPGKLGTCVQCKSSVPLNLPNCLVCDASLEEQNVPRAQLKFSEKSLCLNCGCVNPPQVSSCVACACDLHDLKQLRSARIPGTKEDKKLKSEDARMLTCTKCSRINSSDARFCDWCGTKPSGVASLMPLTCQKCRASNDVKAQFCGTCGVLLTPPLREELRNGGQLTNSVMGGNHGQWLPVSVQLPGWANAVRMETGTQTVGLFFPSQTALQQNHSAEVNKEKEKKYLLTAVSPGRGYWRKQIDHICGHIKAHATNNCDFRALIGDPKMGKLLQATVHEDSYELSLTVTFALRDATTKQNGNHDNGLVHNGNKYMSSYLDKEKSNSMFGSLDSLDSVDNSSRPTMLVKKPIKKLKKSNKENEDDAIMLKNKQLFAEVGKNGKGRIEEVQQLIEEGADLKALNKDGLSLLHVAAANMHCDVIPVFVQEGLNVNTTEALHGNTALHLAVNLGSAASEVVDVLLGCGASTNKKNKKGETAHDVALRCGHEMLARKLASRAGQSAVDKLAKPRQRKESF